MFKGNSLQNFLILLLLYLQSEFATMANHYLQLRRLNIIKHRVILIGFLDTAVEVLNHLKEVVKITYFSSFVSFEEISQGVENGLIKIVVH